MILKNIKLHASHQAGSDIKDCVISIPPNWGWKSKITLINAAYIADLHVLGLINENSAAAINFAITRNDTEPLNIGFFNLGSHNLQFSIVIFLCYQRFNFLVI
jgi:hypoxia up-regulated 1